MREVLVSNRLTLQVGCSKHNWLCVCVSVWWRQHYDKIEMEEINGPARGPERVTNHLIRGKREEPEL